MMSSIGEAWIYAGNCPVCQCGLRRVRVCQGGDDGQPLHGYVMCDDCETMWMSPDLHSPRSFPDSDAPACPICQQPLFGSQARWARPIDLVELGWEGQCIVEPMQTPATDNHDLLEPDDLAVDLDSPEPLPVHHHDLHGNHESPAEQLAEVAPQLDQADEAAEPKPGC
ncbi:MAG: hypothetical protein IT423_05810 [Pirellulaceae bacterium]|nr:hypothetical protein [Pirellulaceae bacterium]